MIHITLFEPEIPPNTGNIIRLAANTGYQLHLIEPLGFTLDEKSVRRAGLDYHDLATLKIHRNLAQMLVHSNTQRVIAFSTKGSTNYADVDYRDEDILLFGPETRGLPDEILSSPEIDQVVRLPMLSGSRSLNLSNCVAVAVFESWRQLGFAGSIDNSDDPQGPAKTRA